MIRLLVLCSRSEEGTALGGLKLALILCRLGYREKEYSEVVLRRHHDRL